MKLLLKGLTDKKLLSRNCLIIVILLFGYSTISLLLKYQENLAKEEYKKEDYRTLYFKSTNPDYSYLKEYDIKTADIQEDGKFMVIFSTYEERNRFMAECKYAYEIETQSVLTSNTENSSVIFKTISIIIIVTIFILIFIFTLNYLLSLQKDLALYKILGYSKQKIQYVLGFIYSMIYTLLYIMVYNTTYISYYLLYKFKFINIYYNLYTLRFSLILLLTIVIFITALIANKESNRMSDIDILKTN